MKDSNVSKVWKYFKRIVDEKAKSTASIILPTLLFLQRFA
jgi:hypothetical protein